jgi:thiamine pyrophosphate-dependent acetolactate synthase large subunit-like protein
VSRSSDQYPLSRTATLRRLVPDPERYLIVSGLGTACFDAARLTDDGPNLFAIDGAMGTAVPVGLGLALARPGDDVLVITGDGEVLMNLGALATVAGQTPPNLSILCIDNGSWGLTGFQDTHTARQADLAAIAAGSGFTATTTVRRPEDIATGAELIADASRPTFVVLATAPEAPEPFPLERDGNACRLRFRKYVLSKES